MKQTLRIGSRGSQLALVQAEMVRAALGARFPQIETSIQPITTRGDAVLDTPLAALGGQGVFIREIEDALLAGRIDLAVHSLKDVPTELPAGLGVRAVLRRDDPRDAWVSRDGRRLEELGAGDAVGTSSLRRRAQLLALSPALRVEDVRGNLNTRLRKLEEGRYAALVLAACGLRRAGYADRISRTFEPDVMLPAVCQGIIGIEVRLDDSATGSIVDAINDPQTLAMAVTERAFLHRLEGGCQVPIGCLSRFDGDRGSVAGVVADPDGRRLVRREVSGRASELVRLAEGLAEKILTEGGREILASIRDR